VFSRLGARQSPSPQRTGGMTIVAPNPDSKKRRVVQQQTNSDEEYAVYVISAIDEETSSQEDDLDPLNPTVYVIEDGEEEEDEDELSANMGTNEPLARAREKMKSKNIAKRDDDDEDTAGRGGTSSTPQSGPKTLSNIETDMMVQMQKQIETYTREMQIMKQEMKKGAEREQELFSLLKTREAPGHISSNKGKGLANDDGPTLMKNDIRASVLQELQIAGAGIEASPYRKRGRPISSNVNVPRWTNLLKIQCPEVDKSPWMLMSRGGRISSNANVPR